MEIEKAEKVGTGATTCVDRGRNMHDAEPVFQPFDDEGQFFGYARHLPHWRQPGATYAVTFRLADSIPARVLAEWEDIRKRWLIANGIDPNWLQTDTRRFTDAYQKIPDRVRRRFERRQTRFLHDELDQCHGSCILRDPEFQTVVSEALHYFHSTRLWLGDSMIMPNHVHALILPIGNWELENLLGSIKKWSSRRIGACLQALPAIERPRFKQPRHRLWQQECFDRIIRDQRELAFWRRYIANNAKKAHLSDGEYLYHSADWLDEFARRE